MDGLVGHLDAAFQHQLLDVAQGHQLGPLVRGEPVVALAGIRLGLPDPAAQGSGCTPRSTASFLICGFGSGARYIRTARSRNSNEYFLGAAMVDVPLMRTI
ncbi:hypothetical protein ABZT03_44695 [Streptomyces sp. NPDC005574]|uniref:hypothetical protein n=1 Tax=Streptomyces sp. NPDC005574 TaxID=3156891 RepID=UPI0033B40CA6